MMSCNEGEKKMSNKINVICDICGHQIPYIAKSGYCVENGCKYISAVIKNTVPAPPNTHQEENITLDICPWCKQEIIKKSIRKRKKDLITQNLFKK
jgi:hypothetical protein